MISVQSVNVGLSIDAIGRLQVKQAETRAQDHKCFDSFPEAGSIELCICELAMNGLKGLMVYLIFFQTQACSLHPFIRIIRRK